MTDDKLRRKILKRLKDVEDKHKETEIRYGQLDYDHGELMERAKKVYVDMKDGVDRFVEYKQTRNELSSEIKDLQLKLEDPKASLEAAAIERLNEEDIG